MLKLTTNRINTANGLNATLSFSKKRINTGIPNTNGGSATNNKIVITFSQPIEVSQNGVVEFEKLPEVDNNGFLEI